MLNYQTLLSSYDDKLTLLQWLKKVEAALADTSLESVEVSQPTETQAVLTFKFADGSELAAPAIELPRGASVVNAMLDASNNLILVLDDGRNINVGNIMPQNINAQSGTFSVSLASPSVTAGDLSVSGDAAISGELYADTIRTDGLESYGSVKGAGLDISGSGSVGGDLAVTGDVTAASFYGDNAKPIYWHGLDMYYGSEGTLFKAHVLTNSPTPFDTLQKLKVWLLSFGNARVDLDGNGCMRLNGVIYPLISLVKVENGNDIKAYYQDANGYSSVVIDILTAFAGINDRVNKIN